MNTALIQWAFEVTEDPSSPIDTMAWTPSSIARPLPFSVHFRPRIEGLKEMLEGDA